MVFLTGSGSPQCVANTLITCSVLSQANLINNNLKKHNCITPNESRYGKRWALLKVKITVPQLPEYLLQKRRKRCSEGRMVPPGCYNHTNNV